VDDTFLTARDSLFQPHRSITAHRRGLERGLMYFLTGVRDTARVAMEDSRSLDDLYHRCRAVMDQKKRTPTA
jgi:hypothetical protein